MEKVFSCFLTGGLFNTRTPGCWKKRIYNKPLHVIICQNKPWIWNAVRAVLLLDWRSVQGCRGLRISVYFYFKGLDGLNACVIIGLSYHPLF
jgi:hypothetical protein